MTTKWTAKRIDAVTGRQIGQTIEFTTPSDDEKNAADKAAVLLDPQSVGAFKWSGGMGFARRDGNTRYNLELIRASTSSRPRKAASKGPKFYLTRIPLDRQGYTKGKYPRYYGVGAPVWALEEATESGKIGQDYPEFRASDREAAKAYVRKHYHPDARF